MAEWYEPGGALNIKSGAELKKFDLGTIKIRGVEYTILTGYESEEDICWWCGKNIIQGKRKAHYCRERSHGDFLSCFRLYHRHFDWGYAAGWARTRAENKCQNCGCDSWVSGLEVHHIIPLEGSIRFFSAYNIPWNLIALCHDCHLEIHATMRPQKKASWEKVIERAIKNGQLAMNLPEI